MTDSVFTARKKILNIIIYNSGRLFDKEMMDIISLKQTNNPLCNENHIYHLPDRPGYCF